MGSVNLVVIVESAQSLITSDGDLKKFHLPSIIAVGAALGKRSLMSHCVCATLNYLQQASNFFFSCIAGVSVINPAKCTSFGRTTETTCSLMVSVCHQTHVCTTFFVLSPSRVGILMSAGGSKLAWWLDPTGAIIVSTTSFTRSLRF